MSYQQYLVCTANGRVSLQKIKQADRLADTPRSRAHLRRILIATTGHRMSRGGSVAQARKCNYAAATAGRLHSERFRGRQSSTQIRSAVRAITRTDPTSGRPGGHECTQRANERLCATSCPDSVAGWSGQRGEGHGNTDGSRGEYEQDASRPGQTHSHGAAKPARRATCT